MIGQTVSHYNILESLGEGGMGQVYKAHDTRLNRTVALKFLPRALAFDKESRTRFVREAQAASALQHHNICTIHDIDETPDGQVFICMECYDGETLKDKIARGPLPVAQAVNIVIQIANGLSRAHGAGTVHRDIKPANIAITNDGVVKILDFGLAVLVGMTRVTKIGSTAGTVAYMSPEQATGKALDHRSDIWSLGVVLYEALTGTLPFGGDYEQAVIYTILNEQSTPVSESRSDVPDPLVAAIEMALKKSADERYQNISEFLADLKSVSLAPIREPSALAGQLEPHSEAALDERRAVAVLPFKMLSGESEFEFLSLALAQAVSHGLSLKPELDVRSTRSVERYAKDEVEPMVVAKELNVSVVVEGSIQMLGPDVRVQVQAWGAPGGSTLLSVKLDGHMDDLFGLQDRLADSLSEGMGLSADKRSGTEVSLRNPRSYELYLRASERLMCYTETDTRHAIEMLRTAVELDPEFANAWSRLSVGLINMGALFDPVSKWYIEARGSVARALALDAENPEAWTARGRMLWSPHHGFQHANALRDLNKACCHSACPADAPVWRGMVLAHIGLHDEAMSAVRQVREFHPDDLMALLIEGETLGWKGDADGFLHFSKDVVARDPAFPYGHLFLPIPLLYLERLEEAETAIRLARSVLGDDAMIMAAESLLWAKRGEQKRAAQALRTTFEDLKSVSHVHHTSHYAAAAYALIGDESSAVQELERAAATGMPNYPAFLKDPHFSALQERPDFKKLMAGLKTGWESFRAEFGES